MRQQNDSTEKLLLEFLETAALVERQLDRALSNTRGISFSEYRLLRSLAEMPGRSASRVDLAGAVGLTPSAVTRALKPLEKLGYVATEKSDRDARRSLATLTRGGIDIVGDAQKVLKDVLMASPLKQLSPKEAVTFSAQLERLRQRT